MKEKEFVQKLGEYQKIQLVGPMEHAKIDLEIPTIYVDGGSRFRSPQKVPSLSLGDGDSAHETLELILPPIKDFSDLSYALNLIPAHIDLIFLQGFWGGRFDHHLINLGECHHFLKGRGQQTFLTMDGRILASSGIFEANIKGTFSSFTLEQCQVQITGQCQYTLPTPTTLLPLKSTGLSNHGEGIIRFETNGILFICQDQQRASLHFQ